MSPIEEKLHTVLDDVSDRRQFAGFANLLIESLERDGHWENKDLRSFLEGLAQVANELEKWYDRPG